MAPKEFTIRIYGLWINHRQEVLLSDEYLEGLYITKFPGGGLEFGEGPLDCLHREWQEEIGGEIRIGDHVYTTDFLQVSVFNPNKQVISIYYLVEPLEYPDLNYKEKVFDFDELEHGAQTFRFQSLKSIKAKDLTLPIDQKVAELLHQKYYP